MNLEGISKQQLFQEITELMQPLYFSVPYDDDNIQKLARQEYEQFGFNYVYFPIIFRMCY